MTVLVAASLAAACSGSDDPANPAPAPAGADPLVVATLAVGNHCLRTGATTTLSWSSTNATACTLDGAPVGTSGSRPTTALGTSNLTQSFTVKCWSDGAEGRCSGATRTCLLLDHRRNRCSARGCVESQVSIYNSDTIPENWSNSYACASTADPCATSTTCAACTGRPSCGWCGSTGQCRTGTSGGPSAGTCSDWSYYGCFNGRCGGTGDSCPRGSCCSLYVSTVCCAPPFCGGNCTGSPCCL